MIKNKMHFCDITTLRTRSIANFPMYGVLFCIQAKIVRIFGHLCISHLAFLEFIFRG